MAKTRTHLANRALEKLMVVGTGQDPESDDTTKVDDVFDQFSAYISGIDLYTIADDQDIDLAAFEPLALYLAWFVASDFGKVQDDSIRQLAEFMLKSLTMSPPTYEPLAVDSF